MQRIRKNNFAQAITKAKKFKEQKGFFAEDDRPATVPVEHEDMM